MPVVNRIAAYADEMKGWRQHLHSNPELEFDCHQTAAFIAARLAEFGVDEIHQGIATSGIVAIINGQGPGQTIGLRSDMDALPITERTGVDYASIVPGRMHACGHDGHMTMLLGAAKYLAETRAFSGRVALIFQPAEEEGAGGQRMVQEGIMERFDIAQVFGIHNEPNLAFGHFNTVPESFMASVDTATVRITGKGGHGALPHLCTDPVMALVAMISGVHTIVSRNVPAMDEAVISVTIVQAGSAGNIIPQEAMFVATIRAFSPDVRDLLKQRFYQIIAGQAESYQVQAAIEYDWGYPPTINHPKNAAFAVEVAAEIVGTQAVDGNAGRDMTSEDFSYMLESRPGAFLKMGIGPGAGLHQAEYNFNDDAAPVGASFFARLVERAQPLKR